MQRSFACFRPLRGTKDCTQDDSLLLRISPALDAPLRRRIILPQPTHKEGCGRAVLFLGHHQFAVLHFHSAYVVRQLQAISLLVEFFLQGVVYQ